MLRTRAPLKFPKELAFDLHVLSAPLTFALSQDQTLQLKTVSIDPPGVLPPSGSVVSVAEPFPLPLREGYRLDGTRPSMMVVSDSVFKDR